MPDYRTVKRSALMLMLLSGWLGGSAISGSALGGCASGANRAGGGRTNGEGGHGGDGFSSGSGVGASVCKVPEEGSDAPPPCTNKAPPDSFTPEIQWEWSPPTTTPMHGSFVIPLVGNFSDDNNDGAIDLCDVPDVITVVVDTFPGVDPSIASGTMYMLAGDSGDEELVFAEKVEPMTTPAFADIDDDGLPEIVTVSDHQSGRRLIAFEHDGSLKWLGDEGGWEHLFNRCGAVAIYDLDGDGSVEILSGFDVANAQGERLWGIDPGVGGYWCPTPTAADLDGDGVLEVVFGHAAYRADGTLLWQITDTPGQPQIANFDSDPEPEIFFANMDGLHLIEADGTVVWGPLRPQPDPPSAPCWSKPAAIHDFDGDGQAEVAAGTCHDLSIYNLMAGPTASWSAAVEDLSGTASGTAFDFLGDGIADAIYTDESQAYVFDGLTGAQQMVVPRASVTLIEYPIVADVDNDGSAEIILVSSRRDASGPVVTVIRDKEDRWVQARRIWNQHAYHVTNVREDGRIPTMFKNSWQQLNTFRANSQIEEVDCQPIPR